IDERSAPPPQRAALWNRRGHCLDRLDRFAEAFAAFSRGRSIESDFRRVRFDPTAAAERLARVAEDFRRDALPKLAPEKLPFQPVFVLGFYRSGTSLIEQILASHRDIAGAGELQTLPRTQDDLWGPAALLRRSVLGEGAGELRGVLRTARQRFLDEARQPPTDWRGQRWVVDKHPFNSMRLGLIHLLFPGATVIRVMRHPLDVILSCYFQFFRNASEWASTLETAATYFALVDDHVAEMKALLPLNYREIRYEDVVAAPEPQIRDLLAFIGAEFDPACLAFHENKRVVRTASYEQVTRKLYERSAGRYRHYLPFVDNAVISRLERALARGGYTVER
ncbi:MAG TPA: sulfotransferase, partial [Alphaproteobacteria bacterium]|nr:sulfotransferase [Alphaproteobacteria bacterium]